MKPHVSTSSPPLWPMCSRTGVAGAPGPHAERPRRFGVAAGRIRPRRAVLFSGSAPRGGNAVVGWYGWYAVRHDGAEGPAELVAAAGFFGPPDEHGEVEIGYSVMPGFRRQGFAGEIVQGLVDFTLTHPAITAVRARAAEDNPASIAVLQNAGFVPTADRDEEGNLCFKRFRD